VRETGSVTVRKLLREPAATSRLSEVEVASALARLAREASISTTERDRALEMLTDDFQTFWVVELIPEVTSLARTLLARHSLRAADAIQLASCMHIRREISTGLPIVVFDDRLAKAAANEDVLVIPDRAPNEA
jgi:predicted nucleic acid-binding protein